VQALFYESLKIGSELANIVGYDHNEEKWTGHAEKTTGSNRPRILGHQNWILL
jgi:hypothetical protein